MKCTRREAFKKELINDWDKLNIAAKILVIIGIAVFVLSIIVSLYKPNTTGMIKNIEVIYRSCLASIFGFILSSNMKSNGKNNINTKGINRNVNDENHINYSMSKQDITTSDYKKEDCNEEKEEYNYNEGNLTQLLLAFGICIISSIVILSIYIFEINVDSAALSQFRDFMCTSIGFLLGESRIK